MQCVADLLAILTNVPEDWRRCPCERCRPAKPLPVDHKLAAANDDSFSGELDLSRTSGHQDDKHGEPTP